MEPVKTAIKNRGGGGGAETKWKKSADIGSSYLQEGNRDSEKNI